MSDEWAWLSLSVILACVGPLRVGVCDVLANSGTFLPRNNDVGLTLIEGL